MREATHQELEGLIAKAIKESKRDAVYWSKTPTTLQEQDVDLLHLKALLEANHYLPRILECYWNPNARAGVLIESWGCSGKKESTEALKEQVKFSLLQGKYQVTHLFFSEKLWEGMFTRAERQALYQKCAASQDGNVNSYVRDLLQHDDTLALVNPNEVRLRRSQEALIAKRRQQLVRAEQRSRAVKREPEAVLVDYRSLKK